MSRNVGRRRKARELLVQALYASRVGKQDLDISIEEAIERRSPSAGSIEYARSIGQRLKGQIERHDARIDALVVNRSASRIGEVERCILQLALCELEAGDEPQGAILNEAVELAQTFSNEDSGRFVNGLLAKAAAAMKEAPGS